MNNFKLRIIAIVALLMATVSSQDYGRLSMSEIWKDAINEAIYLCDQYVRELKPEFVQDFDLVKRLAKKRGADYITFELVYEKAEYGMKYSTKV